MTTMTDFETECEDVSFSGIDMDTLGRFLAEYSAWLWGSGATCVRIDKNVGRIAMTYSYMADVAVMPRHVTVCLSDEGGNVHTYTQRVVRAGINFDLNTELSALSWSIRDGKLSLDDAEKRFRTIVGQPYGNNFNILWLTSLANASFCRLFGGDAAAMGVVFFATAAGYFLKQRFLREKMDIRVIFFLCAFISASLASGCGLFGWGATPGVAVATSVLYLIPGVPYINAASDMLASHYLCSFSRFADAVILTASLSLGLLTSITVMNNCL